MLAATVFDTRGIAFAAWTLVAFAIGAFLGMLLRRVIPAMAATLGAYLGLQLLAWLVLREHYPVAVEHHQRAACSAARARPNSPWILNTWTVGHTYWWRYIPVSRFWPMQFIEAGWLLILAILWVPRRSGWSAAGPPSWSRRRQADDRPRPCPSRPGRDAAAQHGTACRGRECCGSPGGSTAGC